MSIVLIVLIPFVMVSMTQRMRLTRSSIDSVQNCLKVNYDLLTSCTTKNLIHKVKINFHFSL